MPFNPCGFIVDMTRRMHDEPCRFFRNSDRVDVVRFYEALPNAPTLPFFSVVYCAQNDPDKIPNDTIGTLRRLPFEFTGRVSPAGLPFDHTCGTPDDWREGAIYDPAAPPIPVAANGLPRCCNPPKRVGGGAAAGGLALFVVLHPLAVGGGAGAGGEAFVQVNPMKRATAGGAEVGGVVGRVVGPPYATAGGAEVGGVVQRVVVANRDTPGGSGVGGLVQYQLQFYAPPAGGSGVGGVVQYVLNQLPTVAGGVEVGGVVQRVQEYLPGPVGGVEVGGAVPYVLDFTTPTAGGVEVGGVVAHTFNTLGPGSTCGTAGTLTLGVFSNGSNRNDGTDDWWFIGGLVNGLYVVTLTTGPTVHLDGTIFGSGSSCASLGTGSHFTAFSSDDHSVTTGQAWLHVTKLSGYTGAMTYTIRLSKDF